MDEPTKHARLDNWAMFLLSRLQIFFNRTDYCDLTLQFEGNVQLKVHRVIMNACTEYFQLLEQTCSLQDDVLIMPPDLQADVILPIVNFMYTGILEYQHSIFEKLYSTAELMNMSVLLKFLDAQKQKAKIAVQKPPPVQLQKRIRFDKLPAQLPGRKLPVWKRKTAPSVQVNPVKPYSLESRPSSESRLFDNAPKPTRFEWPDEDIKDIKPFSGLQLGSSFDAISYSSKPLSTQEEEMRASNTSLFDDVRQMPSTKTVRLVKTYREREASSSVDMDDIKSYVKEQRIRTNLGETEDPDDPDYMPGQTVEKKRKLQQLSPTISIKKPRVGEKENQTSPKVDHSKIISEVFKKYPHLVQKNKNIRLKIVQKNKPEEKESKFVVQPRMKVKHVTPAPQTPRKEKLKERSAEQTWTCEKCFSNGHPIEFVLYYLYRKHMTDIHHKQYDLRDCKHCGALHEKPLDMAYHMYMTHAVVPPRSVTFPKCVLCAYVAIDKAKMHKHMEYHAANTHHSQCANCKLGFVDEQCLKTHMQQAGHHGKNMISFDCQYCPRQLNSASALYVHSKTTHLEEAKRDGMLSLDENEMFPPELDQEEHEQEQEQEQILEETVTEEQPDIAGSMGVGPYDIVVLDGQQQQYIINDQATQQQTIDGQHNFITLPEMQDNNYINQADIGSTDELVMVLTDHDYNDGNTDTIINNDNSNIVVLYSHPVEGQQNQFITTSQGNILLNSETGLLEIHNNGNLGSQAESIEMIQKEIDSHEMTVEEKVKVVVAPVESETDVGQVEPLRAIKVQPSESDEEDFAERKVIAVEQEGTGQLINTIEEIGTPPDETDQSFAQTPSGNNEDIIHEEPEPMDIDEDPCLKHTEETTLETIQETEETTESSQLQPQSQPEPEVEIQTQQQEQEVEQLPIEETEIATLQTPDIVESVGTVESSAAVVQEPEEMLEETTPEPEQGEIIGNVNETVIETEELPEQSQTQAQEQEVQVQTMITETESVPATEQSANEENFSETLPEQCPEEPMEVDGRLHQISQEQTEEVPVVEEEAQEVTTATTTNESEEEKEQEQEIEATETTTSMVNLKQDQEEKQEEPGQNQDVVDGKVEPATETETQPETIVDEISEVHEEQEIKTTDISSEVAEAPPALQETSENPAENDNVPHEVDAELEIAPHVTGDSGDADPVEETVNDNTNEDPPIEETVIETDTHMQQTETEVEQQEEKQPEQEATITRTQIPSERVDTETQSKKAGISTLLNDWEDTDSQQSDSHHGKGTSVNKLISDWCDD